nr:beta-glucuronidase-like isoform X2 [Halyomorpha halys]
MLGIMYCLPLLALLTSLYRVNAITSPYGWKHKISLSGLWKFKISPLQDPDLGFKEKWYSDDLMWFGDKFLGSHEGGHIPFEFELPGYKGLITVAVNNTLNNHTIPQAFLSYPYWEPGRHQIYSHDFEYFDYAGINRNVFLYRTPKDVYLKDVIIKATYDGQIGYVKFSVISNINDLNTQCLVSLYDSHHQYNISQCYGVFKIPNPILWWDRTSHHKPTAYLYTLRVETNPDSYLSNENIYEMKIGIRKIDWNSTGLWLNGEKLYLRGFGKHEDSELRGRGFDWVIAMRDMDLLQWTGANAMRTAHYPHSPEWIDMADRTGILIILEAPACSLSNFDDEILTLHKKIMIEIYSAYGSHPSIIMWSLANEPNSNLPIAKEYFLELLTLMHSIDTTRPVTFVTKYSYSTDKAAGQMDVICFNRYNGWYQSPGDLSVIEDYVTSEVTGWRKTYNLPVFITEYGAGSLPGLHMLPSGMWSEEYQVDLLKLHFNAFDHLRASGDLSGELLWTFADFAVQQEHSKPGNCMKGIFTRSRQPKKAAYTIKLRYELMNDNKTMTYE